MKLISTAILSCYVGIGLSVFLPPRIVPENWDIAATPVQGTGCANTGFLKTTSYGNCQSLCNYVDTCLFWSWDSSTGSCYLKSEQGIFKSSYGYYCGGKTGGVSNGFEYVGDDLNNPGGETNSTMLAVTTNDQCAQVCHYIEGCFAWDSVAPANGGEGTCIVFNEFQHPLLKPAKNSAIGYESNYQLMVTSNEGCAQQCDLSSTQCDSDLAEDGNCAENVRFPAGSPYAMTCE